MVIPETVPASVSIALHAVRHPQAGSRAGFGNVGLLVQDRLKTSMKIKQFMGSHGAMGGTSYGAQAEEGLTYAKGVAADSNHIMDWAMPQDPRYQGGPKRPTTDKRRDDIAASLVGRWMWDLMKRHGVLSTSADFARLAPLFTGNRVPGHVNVVA